MIKKVYNLLNLLFLWVMSEFQINAKFLEPDITADVFWMGFYHQALETLELSREERKMRTGVLIGRHSMVILVLCTLLKCCVQSAFLVCSRSQGILRRFSASPALQWWGAAGTFGIPILALWPFDVSGNILCFCCPAF